MHRPDLSRWRALIPSDRWARATSALLVLATILVAATFRDYGSTWDERVQQELGRGVVAWFASGGIDQRPLSGGSPGNLDVYGGAFEAAAVIAGRALPFDPVETRHLLNALVALAGAAGTALLARRLGGHRASFFGAALLLTTPAWWGHGFANSKDVPFATTYPWLILAMIDFSDELPRPRVRRVLAAGAALGAGLAMRPGSLILLVPLSAAIVAVRMLPVLSLTASNERPAMAGAAALRLAATVPLGWIGMLALWPYGLCNPISAPLAAVAAARSFQWNGVVRFAGQWIRNVELPRSYVPRWFLATLPETWFAIALVGAIAAAVALWRQRARRPPDSPISAAAAVERAAGRVPGPAWLDPALVAVAGFGPIVGAVIVRPVLYDGVRHLLFVLPALAALAGWALSVSLDRLPRWSGGAALALTAGLASLAVADAFRLHPYQYVYFNRSIAGGLARGGRDYELDYWGATGREAMAWLVKNVGSRGDAPLSVETTADSSVASHWIEGDAEARSRFTFEFDGPPDLRLATTRWDEHRSTGKVLHVVERMGVPLLYVIQTAPEGVPLVLEGGDLAVALSPRGGWWGIPRVAPGEDRVTYLLSRAGGIPAQAEAWLMTPRNGGVPGEAELKGKVASMAAELLGARPETIEPRRVAGPDSRGWLYTSGSSAQRGSPLTAIAGARVGGAAILLFARYTGDSEGAARELGEWIRGARLAARADRRVP